MFVQSAKFKDAHQNTLGKQGDLAIYGQELMAQTRRLCLMNLAVHGLDGDLGQTYGSTFTNDQHKTLRADYILANPPFNISDWDGDKLTDDPRWVHGIPPKGNANFAWLQHMLARLSSRGRAGIVLANGSMSSQQSGEGEIRRAMVQADVVECMVALPGQLFSNTQIPGLPVVPVAQQGGWGATAASTAAGRSSSSMPARPPAAASRAPRSSSPTPTCSGSARPTTAGAAPSSATAAPTRTSRASATPPRWRRWRSMASC
jgi:hypothetical protein